MTEIIELQPFDEDMDGFQFVLRAMKDRINPKATSCASNCVKIIDGQLVGTDGKRLHIYDHTGTYKDGIYRVYKSLKTHVILGPELESDYKKPFPNFKELVCLFDHGVDIDKHFPDSDYGIVDALTAVIREMKSWESINPKHLKDLDNSFVCNINPDLDYLCFKGGRKTAFIYKVKIEE